MDNQTNITDGATNKPDAKTSNIGIIPVVLIITLSVVIMFLFMPNNPCPRDLPHHIVCASNLRQIGLGITLYNDDNATNADYFVYPPDLDTLFKDDFLSEPDCVLQCFSAMTKYDTYESKECDYVLTLRGRLPIFPQPELTAFELPVNHQQRRVNILFTDSDVSILDISKKSDEFVPPLQRINYILANIRNK